MQEKVITIQDVNPLELYGVNNSKWNHFKSYFPKLKIVARDNIVKVNGDENDVENFERKLKLLVAHLDQFHRLSEGNIDALMENGEEVMATVGSDEILVHGPNGVQVKPLSVNQRRLVAAVQTNDMVFAVGPAGTGKTYTAVALAVQALKSKQVKRIILTRPAVEAGESLGFLPGDLKEKLDPYLQPLYDGLRDMLTYERLIDYLENEIIQIAPLAFMRGRTLDKAFVILDEAQNATTEQMKMFLTRMGKNAKFIITGDITQVDLPRKQQSGLIQALQLVRPIDGVAIVKLDGNDVLRHKLVKQIIQAYDVNNPEN